MPELLDWNRFRNGSVGPERAFEAFTAQLFERWLRREFGPEFRFYVLHGAGGDGGVEAFAGLDDEKVLGLQAKWFPDSVNDSRVRQIRKSIDKARETFPDLRQYVVALPRNLTKGTRSAKGKAKKGGVERWGELVESVARDHASLEIIRWDEHALLQQLALAENGDLRALWFEGELPLEVLRRSWERAKNRLRERYLPDLHATGAFEETARSDLWTSKWLTEARVTLQECASLLERGERAFTDFRQHTGGKGDADLKEALDRCVSETRDLARHTQLLECVLASGPRAQFRQLPATQAISSVEYLLEQYGETEDGRFTADLGKDGLASTGRARLPLSDLDRLVRESARPRLITGPMGCGKTHAAAAIVTSLMDADYPAVFLQAKGADPAAGIGALLRDALDLPGWPVSRILDGLESLALLRQTEPEPDGQFCRALLVLDGLEETPGWQQWSEVLSDLAVESKRRPRLHVLVTARPETARKLTVPDKFSRLQLTEDGDVDLPKLVTRYCTKYDVDLHAVPWLGWTVRSPLEVRMLTDVYGGRAITAEEGASSNVLKLFHCKLQLIEQEARQRAGATAWSAHLALAASTLEQLSELTRDATHPYVGEHALLAQLARQQEPEFTAARIRVVTDALVDHGLVDRWAPAQKGLKNPEPEYGLASHQISDFALAHQAMGVVVEQLSRAPLVTFPRALGRSEQAAVWFTAMLAERGRFITEDIWDERPTNAEYLIASALAFVPPSLAQSKRGEICRLLCRSTADNRELLRRLVVPVARIPRHPLGPSLLDEALRALPLTDRDPIWSIPDDLDGSSRWRGNYETILDEIRLAPEVDTWDGLPLVVAWTCSSVVEARRQRARDSLAVWGSRRLDQMVHLVDHMTQVDDPQVVEDVVVAALGAAIGADVADPSLRGLACVVDELFFAESARAWTPDVVVREAARGIVERAALVFPRDEILQQLVKRSRPPYPPRGNDWPQIDPLELRESSQHGGRIVKGDLAWYVAERCFEIFAKPAVTRRNSEERQIDHRLKRAIEDGSLAAPSFVRAAIESERQARQAESADSPQRTARLISVLRKAYRQEIAKAGVQAEDLSEDDLLAWGAKKLVKQKGELEPEYSSEFRALLKHASEVTGANSPSHEGVRNGMLASLIQRWGWSEECFEHSVWTESPTLIDSIIAKHHGRGRTHGSRSDVCKFREKYIWAAVNCVAGELADRLPVWSEEDQAWHRLTTFVGIGNHLPDPLPRTLEAEELDSDQTNPWTPNGVRSELFSDEANLVRRAQRWLVEGELPDPLTLVQGNVENWSDAAVLALALTRDRHEGCLDETLQMRSFGIRPEHVQLLKRDAPHLAETLYEAGAWIESSIYNSPALACWAPWLTWEGEDQGYGSFDEAGNIVWVSLDSLVGTFTGDFAWGEQEVWTPSPRLGRALGIVSMTGGRTRREYRDRKGIPVAVERDVPTRGWTSAHQYLAVEYRQLVQALGSEQMQPCWLVRVYREASSFLWFRGNKAEVPAELTCRGRDIVWLVVGNPLAGELEVVRVRDIQRTWK